MSKPKAALSIFDKIYSKYDASKMLIHTGTIGWIMSSIAQIAAVVMNDKISKEQKMFLIPQEFMDACVNILSFYLVTRSFAAVMNKLTNTGKWMSRSVKNHLVKKGFGDKIGKFDFDISRDTNLRGKMLRNFELHKNGLGMLATTIGTIISCNIITPLLRNRYAAQRQQANIAKLKNPNPSLQNPQTTKDMAKAVIHRTYMQAFMNRDNLKI